MAQKPRGKRNLTAPPTLELANAALRAAAHSDDWHPVEGGRDKRAERLAPAPSLQAALMRLTPHG